MIQRRIRIKNKKKNSNKKESHSIQYQTLKHKVVQKGKHDSDMIYNIMIYRI